MPQGGQPLVKQTLINFCISRRPALLWRPSYLQRNGFSVRLISLVQVGKILTIQIFLSIERKLAARPMLCVCVCVCVCVCARACVRACPCAMCVRREGLKNSTARRGKDIRHTKPGAKPKIRTLTVWFSCRTWVLHCSGRSLPRLLRTTSSR